MKNTAKLLFLSIFLFPNIIHAVSSNYKNGYIITPSMDTIYGQINNATYRENSLRCCFRTTPNDTVQYYTPDDLFGYRFIDGKYYISKYVPQQRRTIFLEYLIQGNLDVYFQQENDNVNRFYVSKENRPMRLLKYELKDRYVDAIHFQQLINTSDSILADYTKDCPEMKPLIKQMKKPGHEKLIRFAKEYHQRVCPEGLCQVFEKKMPSKIYLTTSLGVGYYPLTHKSLDDVVNLATPDYYASHAIQFLFQQAWVSESTYFGIGYADFKRLPVSLYHMPEGKKVMPMIGYELDINRFLTTQNLALGFRLHKSKWSYTLTGNLTTSFFVTPIACAARFGVMYQLR